MFGSTHYHLNIRRLHWLMAALIVLIYLAIEQRGLFPRGSTGRFAMFQSHFWFGISIFFLAFYRISQRIKYGVPSILPRLPAWQHWPAQLAHWALYAFFIVMPVLGIMTAWTDGKTLCIPFTRIALPSLMAENEALAHQLEDLHGQIGDIFYWVIGLHVLAALYHHFVRKDNTLKRMT